MCLVPVDARRELDTRIGITDVCELLYGYWEPNLCPIQEQPVLSHLSNPGA
ncbi:hypothetical protein I79_012604 [Cricetulus griseus]|uniref:Uncharacterized protein n=1 Tax=Cricetulus griseus TaxID=10029 RepID=G3HP96_CRIGR|nr:hypothetical protein I79_012604 [Cricetulus griseus]